MESNHQCWSAKNRSRGSKKQEFEIKAQELPGDVAGRIAAQAKIGNKARILNLVVDLLRVREMSTSELATQMTAAGVVCGLTVEPERGTHLLPKRRTALLSAAVTGKIDVRDTSRGVAGNAERDHMKPSQLLPSFSAPSRLRVNHLRNLECACYFGICTDTIHRSFVP